MRISCVTSALSIRCIGAVAINKGNNPSAATMYTGTDRMESWYWRLKYYRSSYLSLTLSKYVKRK